MAQKKSRFLPDYDPYWDRSPLRRHGKRILFSAVLGAIVGSLVGCALSALL